MLARRRRGGRGAGGGGGGGPRANALTAWGGGQAIIGGYQMGPAEKHVRPEGVPGLTDVAQVAPSIGKLLVIHSDGKVQTNGVEASGVQGQGVYEQHAVYNDYLDVLAGALYEAEQMKNAKTGVIFNQPKDPIPRPPLPLIVAGCASGAMRLMLGADKLAYAFGSNSEGQLGNGWDGLDYDAQHSWEGTLSPYFDKTNGTGTTTLGSETITAATGAWTAGDLIYNNPNLAVFTKVTNVVGTTLTISKPALASGALVALNKPTWRPQHRPWVVQTGPPEQQFVAYDPVTGVATDKTNILQNIKAITTGHEVSIFLLENDEVWYCGLMAGFPLVGGKVAQQLYAIRDEAWKPASMLPEGVHVKAIAAGSRRHYVLLLTDNTIRIVGLNEEGLWGTGTPYNEGGGAAGSQDRQVKWPEREVSPGVFEKLKDIVAIGSSEYQWKAITDLAHGGKLYTCGSNGSLDIHGVFHEEGQQGLGPREAPVLYATEVPLPDPAIALVCNGEERGQGEFGGDLTLVLMENQATKVRSVATWGNSFNDPDTARERGATTGALGDGTTDNKNKPVVIPGISGVVAIAAGAQSMYVTKEPETPVAPVCTATYAVGSKILTVTFKPPPSPVRPAEGFVVRHQNSGTGVPLHNSPEAKVVATGVNAGKLVTPWPAGWEELSDGTFVYRTTPAPDSLSPSIEVLIVETFVTEIFKGTATAVAKKVTLTRPVAVRSEPAYHLWQRRLEAYYAPEGGIVDTGGLSTAVPITSIPVKALGKSIPKGVFIQLEDVASGNRQTFKTSALAAAKATSIPVESLKPNFAYPAGTIALETSTTLREALDPSKATTTIPVTALLKQITVAAKVGFEPVIIESGDGTKRQTFKVTKTAPVGATTLTVASATPTFAFPAGSVVQDGNLEKWNRLEAQITGPSVAVTLREKVPNDGKGALGQAILNGEDFEYEWEGAYEGQFGKLHILEPKLLP